MKRLLELQERLKKFCCSAEIVGGPIEARGIAHIERGSGSCSAEIVGGPIEAIPTNLW